MFRNLKSARGLLALFSLMLCLTVAGAQAAPGKMDSGSYRATASITHATPAINGFDPVAYFEDGRPQRGNGYHTAVYQGVTYLFASEDHLKTFEANPERYVPQFGGYCAYGVAVGKKFHSDPYRWKIVAGKLYLNLDQKIQDKWNEDIPGYIAKADNNWKQIRLKDPREL